MNIFIKSIAVQLLRAATALTVLLTALLSSPNLSAQWERAYGDYDAPDQTHQVIKGSMGTYTDYAIAIGTSDASRTLPSLSFQPPSIVITYTDASGGAQQNVLYDVQAWDKGAGITELANGDIAWTTGALNDANGSYDVLVCVGPHLAAPTQTLMFGGLQTDGGTSIIQLNDGTGDLLVAGFTDSYGNGTRDALVARISTTVFGLVWTRRFHGPFFDRNDEFYDLQQGTGTTSGMVYLVGRSGSYGFGSDYDMQITMIDPSGPTLLASRYFGDTPENDGAEGLETYTQTYSMQPNVEKVAVVGEVYSWTTLKNDACVLVMDNALNFLWAEHYDFNKSNPPIWDHGYDIIKQESDGDISPSGQLVVVGQTNNNSSLAQGTAFSMLLPDNGGFVLGGFRYKGGSIHTSAHSITHAPDPFPGAPNYYVGGQTYQVGAGDEYLLRLNTGLDTGCENFMLPDNKSIFFGYLRDYGISMVAEFPPGRFPTVNATTNGDPTPLCN